MGNQTKDEVYYISYFFIWLAVLPFTLSKRALNGAWWCFKKLKERKHEALQAEDNVQEVEQSQAQTDKGIKRPGRSADVILTKKLDENRTMRFWFYFREGLVARNLIVLKSNGNDRAEHVALPVLRFDAAEREQNVVQRLVKEFMQESVPLVTDVKVEQASPPISATEELPSPGRQAKPKAQKPTKGPDAMVSYTGILVKAGVFQRFNAKGPFKHYGVELEDERGIREHAYGADLQRCIQESGAKPGDKIAVELMKKSDVASTDGKSQKGIWKLTVIQRG